MSRLRGPARLHRVWLTECGPGEQTLSWNQAGPLAAGTPYDVRGFNARLELGEQVELARNGPLRYVARCVYDPSPGEDFNADNEGFVQRDTDPVGAGRGTDQQQRRRFHRHRAHSARRSQPRHAISVALTDVSHRIRPSI